MSYKNRIKAKIQANNNRIESLKESIIKDKATIQEMIYTNEFLESLIKAEESEGE